METGISMSTPIRYKKFNGEEKPLCDYRGKCKNIGYAEVYFPKSEKNENSKGWSYLCKKHFEQEKRRFNNQLLHWVLPNKSQKFLSWATQSKKRCNHTE